MKKPIVVANWKMNLLLSESIKLISDFKKNLKGIKDIDIVVCPSPIALDAVGKIIFKSDIKLGAQNIFWAESGAYTGETSIGSLKEINGQYVIIGHSERRGILGETNSMVNQKIHTCIENDLVPILCIGETHDERHEKQTDNILYRQLRACLEDIHLVGHDNLVVAYEPIWAIGTGDVVDPDEAERVFELIQQILMDIYPLTIVKNNVRMIYGGSVDNKNVSNFSSLKLLDGFLVGGASLKVDKFTQIVKSI